VEDAVSEEREENEPIDLAALPAMAPPAGFADRVMARVDAEPRKTKQTRRWSLVGAAVLAAAASVAGVRIASERAASSGAAIATDRVELTIGHRARAVLEPGASVEWKGDDVVQARGDVFYRVEPGATFRVHTPAGVVEVRGTCFTVKVMQKRDVKAGSIGAALSALAFVAVYEGRVAVSHAQENAVLSAGESAKLGDGHVERTGSPADAEKVLASAAVDDAPLAKANENLAAQVGEYRKRLELVAAERATLEASLAKAEAKLAGEKDGAPPRTRNDFDLDKDDWAELAKKGEVKYRAPCLRRDGWTPSPAQIDKLGLAPHDAPVLDEAYKKSYQRVWAQIRPLCQAALGSTLDVVDKIGPDSCAHLVYDVASSTDGDAAAEAHTQAAEIRAGLRPEPGPNDKVHPVTKMFLALTGAMPAFEADLAKSLGPEEAHRIAFADGMCKSDHRWGSGKKREAPKP
jgi:hypothetical protein